LKKAKSKLLKDFFFCGGIGLADNERSLRGSGGQTVIFTSGGDARVKGTRRSSD